MGNSFTTTTATPPPGYGGMTLTEARATVLQFARDAAGSDSPYSAAQVDRAIRFVGDHFVRETKCLVLVSSTVLSAGDDAVDVSALANFRPQRLLAAYASGVADPLDRAAWDDLWRRRVTCPASGPPRAIAFEDWATAAVYPKPDQSYTLKLRWLEPFTAWTLGTGSPDDVTLNIPTDWLSQILVYGVTSVLQHNEEAHRYASESWKKYLDLVASLRGEGGLGPEVADRVNPWAGTGAGGYSIP